MGLARLAEDCAVKPQDFVAAVRVSFRDFDTDAGTTDTRGAAIRDSLVAALADMQSDLDALVATIQDDEPDEIEERIDWLLEQERWLDQELSDEFARGEQVLRLLRPAPKAKRNSVEPVLRECLDVLQRAKEALRDARWRLIIVLGDKLEGMTDVIEGAAGLESALAKLRD